MARFAQLALRPAYLPEKLKRIRGRVFASLGATGSHGNGVRNTQGSNGREKQREVTRKPREATAREPRRATQGTNGMQEQRSTATEPGTATTQEPSLTS